MKIVSLFTGAGGLDLGFEQAGFKTIWANEFDQSIWDTFQFNFPDTTLVTNSIVNVDSASIPDADGIIGGPPCQSWSEAGAGRGINDERGKLFYEYVRVLKDKKPKFFLAENVSGILLPRHKTAFNAIIHSFNSIGYNVWWSLLNASNYSVPQDRKRVIIIGFRKDLNINYLYPSPSLRIKPLRESIGDMPEPLPALESNKANNPASLAIPNHEYMTGGFSSIYMSRNRVRAWDEVSFTIQAGGRHAPIHPSAPKMKFIEQNVRIFKPGHEHKYRRLSVRECARIQTFPDNFIFMYNKIADGYKMVGNAVPVELARVLACSIKHALQKRTNVQDSEMILSEPMQSVSMRQA
ncbi:MAG TPA: DNA cytosine methyltransferase [Candidatus Cloacimonetes bacterium]|nr:DNA cytosine methyltransferase [Candidatus Cloacimonadota bacterium]